MKTNKEKFMEYADLRVRMKKYKEKLIQQDVTDIQIKGMERTRRRKVGQF